MTELIDTPTGATAERLLERLFTATIETLEIASVHLGDLLGFYRQLADGGPATPPELAARSGTAERYTREWLEQQAVAGFLTVDDPDVSADERRYRLPDQYREVLVDQDGLSYFTPMASIAVGVLRPIDALVEAFHTGAGVPFESYGPGLVDAIGAINRPQFINQMSNWLGSVPEVDARLRAPDARVADVACGTAWSSIAIARAYPEATVDALDIDETSIARAVHNATDTGLADRVRPRVHDASAPDLGGRYDLVTVFEALHDMNHPVQALRSARASLRDGGRVLVADERVADRFAPNGDDLERLNYGFSIVHCLAVGMIDPDAEGTGTVIRADTVRAYATAAGFARIDVLPIENDFWRFYLLIP